MLQADAKCACKGSTLMRFVQPIVLTILCKGPDHGYSLLEKIGQTAIWKGNAPDAAGVYRILRDMEKRGLVQGYIDLESKAAIGKRVFSITDEGRECMGNWLHTLREYNEGIKDVIMRLEQAAPNIEERQPNCCSGMCQDGSSAT